MKKQIALGIAAAVVGVSGVAGALVSANQITALGASESGASVNHDQLAANCWMITGAANDAGCDTSVAGVAVPALSEIPDVVDGVDIPDATGLLAMASDAATDAAATAQSMVGNAVPTAQNLAAGATPSACKVTVPVTLPVSAGVFSTGLNLFHRAQDLAMNKVGLARVSSPVPLSTSLPVSADDVINTIQSEAGCLTANAGGSLPVDVPSICSVTGGLPAAVTGNVPAEVSGLLKTVVDELANVSGQGINVASNGTVGANCNVDGALGQLPAVPTLPSVPTLPTVPSLPVNVVPAAPGLPALPTAPALPTVPDVTGVVGGVVNTVTGAVDVPALPLPTSTPSCSASGSVSIGGLLGSLTSTITGGCK